MNKAVLVKVDLEDNYSHKLDEAFQQVDEIINEKIIKDIRLYQ